MAHLWRVTIRSGYDFDHTYRACPGDTMEEAIDYALEVMSDPVTEATALRAWARREDCTPPYVTLSRVKRAAFKREGMK